MSKSLALLSGKGGSGKTTLALSIASMLSSCGVKVLLIDCDLSTNGATYFYEDKLNENKFFLQSFNDVLRGNVKEKLYVLNINKYFDFLPSILKITDDEKFTYSLSSESRKFFKDFYLLIDKQYDVVIYDCQAGYTDLLKIILPYINTNLFVMEADAISSASIRSLYLKIGNLVNDTKVYQIFNKVTNEEYDIYSKISGGTVFTSIETVVFDWKIRKAFSIAQIPDMENTSANYGLQVFNICNILFPEGIISKKLELFKTIIEINKKSEDEKKLNKQIEDILQQNKSMKKRWIKMAYLLFFPIIMCTFYLMIDNNIFSFSSDFSTVVLLMFFFVIIMLCTLFFITMETTKESREKYKKINKYKDAAFKLNCEIEELKKKYSDARANQVD